MEKLYAYRRERGMTQGAFARLVCVDQSVISKLERGILRPSLDLALRIATQTGGAVAVESWAHPGGSGAAPETVSCLPPEDEGSAGDGQGQQTLHVQKDRT